MDLDKETALRALERFNDDRISRYRPVAPPISLLAWHNDEENGRWDPVDLWSVDADIADHMLPVLQFLREHRFTRPKSASKKEIEAILEAWRGARV